MAGTSPEPSPEDYLLTTESDDAVASAACEAALSVALRRLESFLAFLGFHHSTSHLRLSLCCSAFILAGVAAPTVSIYVSRCPSVDCEDYQIERFEFIVLVFQASLAIVSLCCISWNLRKHGIKKFLFVNRDHGQIVRFQEEYVQKIKDYFSLLLWWILPCFLVKTAREVIRFLYIFQKSKWKSVVVLSASLLSWVYLTSILLSACSLFSLVCTLQGIHFDDYGELLKRDVDASVCLQEHWHLLRTLSKISHRFRIFLLLLFLFVTASQFVTLFQTTGFKGIVSFSNAGDLAVSSVVQVVGVVLCLHAAAKISHRAQRIAALGSRWHAAISCLTNDSFHLPATNSSTNLEAISANTLTIGYSESDLQSLDNEMQNNYQLTPNMTSYHRRQALVLYLQSNPGGITIFGWTVDRALLNTLFFLELTLVLFVLGKTIVFPS